MLWFQLPATNALLGKLEAARRAKARVTCHLDLLLQGCSDSSAKFSRPLALQVERRRALKLKRCFLFFAFYNLLNHVSLLDFFEVKSILLRRIELVLEPGSLSV